jgi:excisionase family DNA binding protein
MALKDKYFTISEAAKELRVTRQTVSRWIKEGKFHAENIGRETLILKKDINKLQHEQMERPFINFIIQQLRVKLNYSEEEKIEVLERSAGNLILLVTKADGTHEELHIPISKIKVVDDDKGGITIQLDVKKVTVIDFEPKSRKKGGKSK